MADAEHNWCAGLRVTRSRSLSVAEFHKLRLSRRLTIVNALAWLLGIPVLLTICVAAIGTSSALQGSFTATFMVILAVLIIFLGVPLCIAIANDFFKRAGVLKRQCRDSKVLVCEGAVADLIAQPKELKKLCRQIGQNSEVVLEVLMQSGLVWESTGVLKRLGWSHRGAEPPALRSTRGLLHSS